MFSERKNVCKEPIRDCFYSVDARGSVLSCPLSDCAVGNAARLFYGRDVRLVLLAEALDILINQKKSLQSVRILLDRG